MKNIIPYQNIIFQRGKGIGMKTKKNKNNWWKKNKKDSYYFDTEIEADKEIKQILKDE